jgi:hypothetical protein
MSYQHKTHKLDGVCVFWIQVVVVLQQVLTLIQNILSKWLNDSEVVEVCVYVYRYVYANVYLCIWDQRQLQVNLVANNKLGCCC